MKALLTLTLAASLALAATASAETRSWTNDQGKSITAELDRVEGENAVLTMNGKEYPIAITTLSAADQAFIKDWQATQAATSDSTTEGAAAGDSASASKLITAMEGNLVVLDGRELVDYQFENADEIDVVAFYSSASWCGPCQAFSPTLSRKYKSLKRKYPNFELVLLTSDRDRAAWEEYIKDHKMPFPALDFDKKGSAGTLSAGKNYGYIPSLLIKTADGEVLDDASKGAAASLENLEDILKERAADS